jgi:hypothetical protein
VTTLLKFLLMLDLLSVAVAISVVGKQPVGSDRCGLYGLLGFLSTCPNVARAEFREGAQPRRGGREEANQLFALTDLGTERSSQTAL